jgi:hypothetical protein
MNSTLFSLVAALVVSASAQAASLPVRQDKQQARIAKGVASGELTARETVRLERREARVHAQIVKDRLDGGGMTAHERAKNQRKMNRLSRDIYRQKHDAQKR